jgi:8-oxo-dGTP diphosphatase
MERRIKQSVAVMILQNEKVLAVRRPDNDDELPGVWGLPAGTAGPAETTEDVIRRIGTSKLRVSLRPARKISFGTQERPGYRLEMELWEAFMEGTPTGVEWQWADVDLFRAGAASGSLCCDLALKSKAASADISFPTRDGS